MAGMFLRDVHCRLLVATVAGVLLTIAIIGLQDGRAVGALRCNHANLMGLQVLLSGQDTLWKDVGGIQERYSAVPSDCLGRGRILAGLLSREGAIDDAISLYQQHLSRHPGDVIVWFALAEQLRSENGTYEQTIEAYRHAGAASRFMNGGIQAYEELNDQGAIASLSLALEVGPPDRKAAYYLGLAYQRAGDLTRAADAFRLAIQISETDPRRFAANSLPAAYLARSYAELARSLWQLHGDWPEARRLFDQAIATSPGEWYILIQKCETARLAGFLDEALSACRASLEVGGETFESTFHVGLVHFSLRDFSTAVRWFQKARSFNPRHASTMALLASSWLALGKVNQARAAFDDQVMEETTDTYSLSTYALLLQRTGELDRALYFYRRVCSLDPNNPEAVRSLIELGYGGCKDMK